MPIPLIIAIDAEHEARIVGLLAEHQDRVQIARRPADDIELQAAAHAGHGSIAIVTPHFPGMTADLVAALGRAGVRVLCLTLRESEARAMGAHGTADPHADPGELIEAIDALPADPLLPPRPVGPPMTGATRGRIIAVTGVAGAPGRTATAITLADELARIGHRVLLVDADLVAPAIAASLGLLDEASPLAALARLAGRGELDQHRLVEHLASVRPGLEVIAGLTRPERWSEIGGASLWSVVASAAARGDVVIVDLAHIPPGRIDDGLMPSRELAVEQIVERADIVLYLAGAEVLGMQRAIGALLAEEPPRADRLVLTRARAQTSGRDADRVLRATVGRFLGERPIDVIDDDRAAFDEALRHGRTLAEARPQSTARRQLAVLAGELMPPPATALSRPRRRRGSRARGTITP